MGSIKVAERTRDLLLEYLRNEVEQRLALNALRNPFKDYEKYLLPAVVGLVSWICSVFLSVTCSSNSKVCKSVETNLVSLYWMTLFFLIFVFWKQILVVFEYLKNFASPEVLEVLQGSAATKAGHR